ncbi:NTP transferase domain-containing protein [bacterium]|nr:NTP transferase domain-containing protein [bacterium]
MKSEAIILAAGKGTRMKSDLPKVMHEIMGRPLVGWIIEALSPLCDSLNVVTGHGRELVEKYISANFKNVKFSLQPEQNGTGGAVKCAIPNLSSDTELVVICAGDTPLIKTETFVRAAEHFARSSSDLLIVSTILGDAGHYGRILREPDGSVKGIVEYLDACEKQREIREINSGIYLVKRDFLAEAVQKIKNDNVKGEYYLTDIVEIAKAAGKRVSAYVEEDSLSLSGINDQEQLRAAAEVLKTRKA